MDACLVEFVVAELQEPRAGYAIDGEPHPIDPKLAGWIDAGIVTRPTVPKSQLPASPVRLEEGTAARILNEDRGSSDR